MALEEGRREQVGRRSQDIRTVRGYVPRGMWYDRCQARGPIPGSGVNLVGQLPG